MQVFLQIACTFLGTLVAYRLYHLVKSFYLEYTSPLSDLPGPESPSFFSGNLKQIWASEDSNLQDKWFKQYGPTIRYAGILGGYRLFTTDLRAVSHILNNAYDYPKPPHSRYNIGRVIGKGVLVVEGEKHKQQRRTMNPAFGPAQIRELNTIFLEKSLQLRDLWTAECAAQGSLTTNVLSWLSRLTLDVIGLAGFNYKFNSLNPSHTPNELTEAFTKIFATATRSSPLVFIKTFFPVLRFIPDPRDAEISRAHETMSRIGHQLLDESHARLRASGEKGSSTARDLLSLLVKANMSSGVGEHQRMADSDVLAQVPTFLVAGHETTSTATTWALFALTQSPDTQIKLRDELLRVDTDTPTMDELNALPYLDWVVRETLRVHSPVPGTVRIAGKDDVIPLSRPFVDRKGKVQIASGMIRKGQVVMIPITTINRDETLWGEDARAFKPERWEKIPDTVKSIPGVWGNLLSFIGGPRSCIGYRFSLVEMKAILFTLVRAFEFELAVPGAEIAKKSVIVQRPLLRSNPGAGNQMPIIIKPYQKV
ncbi:cytochrome P450 [Desarmillaria tabescens]|uniref:Cytochrome P450 n=1 Tax=Armillaria tabescens TaxID=1929756 RepID=A0AA39J8N7_ARMTA|nr:cytochrome P450 [Desarmillaria tabescens]KAK0438187.1 cytochrome P450 [Desarmillaria tabescens]